MPTDARSTNLNMPLPHEDNDLSFDIPRVRESLITIDGIIPALQASIDGKAATGHDHVIGNIQGLQTALDDLNAALSGVSAQSLDDLEDVTAASAVNGMVLLYIAGAWQAAKLAAANVVMGSSDVETELTALSDAITSVLSSIASLTSTVGQKANSADLGDLAGKDQVGTGDLNTSEVKAALGLGYETRIVDGKAQFKDGSTWKDIDGEALAKANANETAVAAALAQMFGVDQRWQEFTSPDRIRNTVYQNTTGRPIALSIIGQVQGPVTQLHVGESAGTLEIITSFNANLVMNCYSFTVVPDQHFYEYVSNVDPWNWNEMRL